MQLGVWDATRLISIPAIDQRAAPANPRLSRHHLAANVIDPAGSMNKARDLPRLRDDPPREDGAQPPFPTHSFLCKCRMINEPAGAIRWLYANAKHKGALNSPVFRSAIQQIHRLASGVDAPNTTGSVKSAFLTSVSPVSSSGRDHITFLAVWTRNAVVSGFCFAFCCLFSQQNTIVCVCGGMGGVCCSAVL